MAKALLSFGNPATAIDPERRGEGAKTYPVADLHYDRIKRRPVLGGLINEYERAA